MSKPDEYVRVPNGPISSALRRKLAGLETAAVGTTPAASDGAGYSYIVTLTQGGTPGSESQSVAGTSAEFGLAPGATPTPGYALRAQPGLQPPAAPACPTC